MQIHQIFYEVQAHCLPRKFKLFIGSLFIYLFEGKLFLYSLSSRSIVFSQGDQML